MSARIIITGSENPVLRRKAKPIERVTKEIKALIKDMEETMEGKGVGLAAPQVGESVRLCLIPVNGKDVAAVNPEILSLSAETTIDEEGCLSLPGMWLQISRSVEIVLAYTDSRGKRHERKLTGFEARVAQHETDHLDGILMIDRAAPAALAAKKVARNAA